VCKHSSGLQLKRKKRICLETSRLNGVDLETADGGMHTIEMGSSTWMQAHWSLYSVEDGVSFSCLRLELEKQGKGRKITKILKKARPRTSA